MYMRYTQGQNEEYYESTYIRMYVLTYYRSVYYVLNQVLTKLRSFTVHVHT